MVLEMALGGALTLGVYKSGGFVLNIMQTNWSKAQDFRRLFWSKKRWAKEYDRFHERVWKLEVANGVGLSEDTKDWLRKRYSNVKIKAREGYLQSLAESGNGHVDTKCVVCNKYYRPHEHFKNFYNYKLTKEQRKMMQVVCKNDYFAFKEMQEELK